MAVLGFLLQILLGHGIVFAKPSIPLSLPAPCQLRLSRPDFDPEMIVFIVTSNEPATQCNVDVKVIAYPALTKLRIKLECPYSQTIIITNKTKLKYVPSLARIFIFSDCAISLQSMGDLGEVLYFPNLRLINWHEPPSLAHHANISGGAPNVSLGYAQQNETIFGLKVLQHLMLAQKTPNHCLSQSVFTYYWPNLRSFKVTNFMVSTDEMNLLQVVMPNLKLLHVTKNRSPNFSKSALSTLHSNTLKSVTLTYCSIRDIQELSLGRNVEHLNLSHNNIESISAKAIQNIGRLRSLDLSYNRIQVLPKISSSELRRLYLDHNRLTWLNALNVSGLTGLEEFSLTSNKMTSFDLYTLSYVSSLRIIKLSNNNISSVTFITGSRFTFPKKIQALYLDNNNLSFCRISILFWLGIGTLDLSGNKLSFMTLKNYGICRFYADPSRYLTRGKAILTNNMITNIALSGEDIKTCEKGLNLSLVLNQWDLTGNKLICDCNAYPLYHLMQKYPEVRKQKYLETWRCETPPRVQGLTFRNITAKDFKCDTDHADCPPACDCLLFAYNNLHFVNCSARNLTDIPKILPNATHQLDLQHNNIVFISDIQIYNRYLSLKGLDVSNNLIHFVDDEISDVLQNFDYVRLNNNKLTTLPKTLQGKNVTLYLSGNQFRCDCHSDWLVEWLVENKQQIPDFANIQCLVVEQSQSLPIMERFNRKVHCVIHIGVKAAVVLAFILVIVPLLVGLLYHYRDYIKVYIYIHFKWHPFNKCDDTNIRGKRFDAVVAYADTDLRMVLDELVLWLESPERGFQLCIRERNFYPGALKTKNAISAMENSRRMIVCVTRNFLDDNWCLFVFNMGHMRVIMKRTNYIIFILFDDIEPEDMDEDMRIYMQTNSYIKRNDRLFREKLLYAMPEVPLDTLLGFHPPEGYIRFPFPGNG